MVSNNRDKFLLELSEFYAEVGNLVTNYSLRYLSHEEVKDKYNKYPELSYPGHSLITRIQNFHQNTELPFIHVWDNTTLSNVVLKDKLFICRDLRNLCDRENSTNYDYFNVDDIDYYSNDELLCCYFGQCPTREQLVDYIRDMITVEYDITPIGDELPIASLMTGIFYIPGYQRKEDQSWLPTKGNLDLLSTEDLISLSYLFGISNDQDDEQSLLLGYNHDKIIKTIIAEQNSLAWELLQKGYTERQEGYSMTEMIIQEAV